MFTNFVVFAFFNVFFKTALKKGVKNGSDKKYLLLERHLFPHSLYFRIDI